MIKRTDNTQRFDLNMDNFEMLYGDLTLTLKDVALMLRISTPTIRRYALKYLPQEMIDVRARGREYKTPVPGSGKKLGRPSKMKEA